MFYNHHYLLGIQRCKNKFLAHHTHYSCTCYIHVSDMRYNKCLTKFQYIRYRKSNMVCTHHQPYRQHKFVHRKYIVHKQQCHNYIVYNQRCCMYNWYSLQHHKYNIQSKILYCRYIGYKIHYHKYKRPLTDIGYKPHHYNHIVCHNLLHYTYIDCHMVHNGQMYIVHKQLSYKYKGHQNMLRQHHLMYIVAYNSYFQYQPFDKLTTVDVYMR